MRVIELQITFGPEVSADQIRSIKRDLHERAQKLTEGIASKSVMSVIRVQSEPPWKGRKR